MHILPLRQRQADIPILFRHFLSHFAAKYNKNIMELSPEAEKMMASYSWPGNVRELKNLAERFIVLENITAIMPEHLPHWITEKPAASQTPGDKFILPEAGISIADMERDLIMQALEKAGQNKTQAAKLLDMSYDSFRSHLKKYGLK